ncbi:TPM domain-containing protein [Paludisphaera soli]|uniref:TPM domain-containing protein n=1 Tax=Paludisphaera soli TaxID=2712865 RepID=UPI0013EB3B74|nr:TPM domain-containing protein [Paludisphaera soli]
MPSTMTLRWSMPLLAAAALALAGPAAHAAEVRDRAGMFSPQAVKKVQEELTRIEKQTRVPITIETIESIPGLGSESPTKAITKLAVERDREVGAEGIYILLSKKDRVLSNVLVRQKYAGALPEPARMKIREAFIGPFKNGDYDGGLAAAAAAIDSALPDRPVMVGTAPGARGLVPRGEAPGRVQVERREQRPGQFGFGSLLMIGLGILAVLFVVRLIGGAFNGGRNAGYPQGMPGPGGMGPGGMGPGPGYGGPGYGGPGYGGMPGRGGGFFSGMLGGLGGAVAGNWLYDQFSGRHSSPGQQADASSHAPLTGQDDFGGDPYGDSIVGGDDGGGQGGSWGDSGGGDWGGGGGDWGGGDEGGSW